MPLKQCPCSLADCGEGEDGAAGTLQVNAHSEEKLQSSLNPWADSICLLLQMSR